MWDIAPVQGNLFDCQLGLLISYVKFLELDYRYVFAKTIGFYFHCDNTGTLLKDKLHLCRPYAIYDMLEKYCGLYIAETKHANLRSLRQFVSAALSQSPIVFGLDAFDCPWCLIYQKHHFDHYLMIVDFDKSAFYCIDTYFPSKGVQTLTYDQLTQWTRTAIVLSTMEQRIDPNALLKDFCETLLFLDGMDYPSQVVGLQDYLCGEDVLRLNIEGYEAGPNHSPFFLILRSIVMQRKQFAITLAAVSDLFEDRLEQIKESFESATDLYSSLHIVILKQMVTDRYDKSRLSAILDQIAEKERQWLQCARKTIKM